MKFMLYDLSNKKSPIAVFIPITEAEFKNTVQYDQFGLLNFFSSELSSFHFNQIQDYFGESWKNTQIKPVWTGANHIFQKFRCMSCGAISHEEFLWSMYFCVCPHCGSILLSPYMDKTGGDDDAEVQGETGADSDE